MALEACEAIVGPQFPPSPPSILPMTMTKFVKVASILKENGRLSSKLRANPSAYQIRFGGCKGVVVECPRLTGERYVQAFSCIAAILMSQGHNFSLISLPGL